MLNHLKILPVELLPEDQTKKIISILPEIIKGLTEIKNFTIETANPINVRDELIENLKKQSNNLYSTAHIYIPYLAYQKGEVQKNINELNESVAKATKLIDQTKISIEEKGNEIDDIIAAARDASASVGVAHFTVDFTNEYDNLEKSAQKWLAATVSIALLTIISAFLISFVMPLTSDATTAQIVQLLTSKAIILGLLFTATIWSGRLYKATKHQAAINKHRANALKTFQAFTKAASDESSRDAVLMETTKSIFAIAPSGYLENEMSSDSGLKIVEVIKHATQATAAANKI
jgi:hypothetical protein